MPSQVNQQATNTTIQFGTYIIADRTILVSIAI